MCGLTGFWRPDGIEADPARAQVTAMADRLHHRGPDDGGAWVDGAAGIALGHRRLAIVDLSAAGHQPMASADGRWLVWAASAGGHEQAAAGYIDVSKLTATERVQRRDALEAKLLEKLEGRLSDTARPLLSSGA